MSLLTKLQRRIAPKGFALREFRRALKKLGPDSITIDCGANIGLFTMEMASSGATVYSFEPNYQAYMELVRQTKGLPNVVCFNKAVSDKSGNVKLFLHENADDDPIKWSTGSSMLAYKGNINEKKFNIVESVDLAAFIIELENPVALLKIDVEGAEIAILNRLIDEKIHLRVKDIFVEVHDHKISELVEQTNKLRSRLRDEGIANINLDWQ